MITKSTIFFTAFAVLLLSLILAVSWNLVRGEYQLQPPQNSTVDLGLPTLQTNEGEKGIAAQSGLLYDIANKRILVEKNGFDRRPIASLTKLMTAVVALDHGIILSEQEHILPEEFTTGGHITVFPGEALTMKDLLAASLLGSANNATKAYVRHLRFAEGDFVTAMNRKAVEIGLEQTEFTDITGLDPNNLSTAYEIALLAAYAFNNYPIIAELTSMGQYTHEFIGSDREHTIKNTNKLISELGHRFAGSKTGYLYESQYCLVVHSQDDSTNFIAVVLGSPSEQTQVADVLWLLGQK